MPKLRFASDITKFFPHFIYNTLPPYFVRWRSDFFILPLLFVFSFVCSIFALLIVNLLIMKLLGNILWLLFGGLECALGYFAGSLALMITIIGIPFGIQTFKLGILCLWPFGSQVRENPESNGCLSLVMNIFWLIFGGLATCLGHLFFGILLCLTI